MAGLYPTDEVINMFGTNVNFPGLDPETHKFTDGDFSDPLIKPSFIPAKSFNLILDNLGSFINGLGLEANNTDSDQLIKAIQNKYSTTEWLKDYLFPVGCSYIQHVNDLSPLERNLPGSWELWNARADNYGLTSGTLPNYTTYTSGTNYVIGSYALYHLPGDDYALYKAKETISNAPKQLDPVKWDKIEPSIYVERRFLQEWTDNDFTIGTQINNGGYNGWHISEIIVPGSKFFAAAGGNRPPFGEGTAGEERHTLTVAEMPSHTHIQNAHNHAIKMVNPDNTGTLSTQQLQYGRPNGTGYTSENSTVGTTATNQNTGGGLPHDNIPPTISVLLWRRVS